MMNIRHDGYTFHGQNDSSRTWLPPVFLAPGQAVFLLCIIFNTGTRSTLAVRWFTEEQKTLRS
jgi:hypothetical protein